MNINDIKNGPIYIAFLHQPSPSEAELKLRQREFVLAAVENGVINKCEVLEVLKAIRE